MRQSTRRRSSRLQWGWFAAATAAGIPLGLSWWLLAPGGLNLITRDPALAEGTNPQAWLPRDLTLAGLLVFAGCLLAVFFTDRNRGQRPEDFALCLAGGLAGAVIAWQAGVFAAQLWGPQADTGLNASVAFSLRSLSVLLLWPAATAVSTFAISLLALLRQAPGANAGPVAGDTAPGA